MDINLEDMENDLLNKMPPKIYTEEKIEQPKEDKKAEVPKEEKKADVKKEPIVEKKEEIKKEIPKEEEKPVKKEEKAEEKGDAGKKALPLKPKIEFTVAEEYQKEDFSHIVWMDIQQGDVVLFL